MLVLTRKPGEQIIIADNIRITVVSVGPGRVKIGVEAPPTVKVDRQEVFEKRQAEQVAAAPAEEVVPPPMVVDAPSPSVAPAIHNRIADKLPPEPGEPVLENRLKRLDRRFLPRKPR
jgi:carbon storage regulator